MPTAPTRELGAPAQVGLLGWDQFYDEFERADNLRWPQSNETYAAMLNDSQIDALRQAITLPLMRRRWLIDPNGAPDAVVERMAGGLGLPILGRDAGFRPRGRGRFSWGKHLDHVLRAPWFGHYYFEQVYNRPAASGQPLTLRKLAPRPPRTISQIKVEPDGGLKAIVQSVGLDMPEIPVSSLVAYVWDQEGGNWVGRSMLRSVYREWLLKDRLLRVDAINHERAGGVPVVEAPPGADEKDLERLAALAVNFRVGERAGGAVPNGSKVHLVSGGNSKVIESIRYLDESTARSFLAMFLMLGSTSSAGLNGTGMAEQFVEFFALAGDAVADWVCDVTNDHVIEDDVDWNDGAGVEFIPRVVSQRDENPELDASQLAQFVSSGLLTVDPELEDHIRGKYDLPLRPETMPLAPASIAAAEQRDHRAKLDALRTSAAVTLPDREMRREPNAAETAAAVDFAVLDATYSSTLADLVDAWKAVRSEQVAELAEGIVSADEDPTTLAMLQATPGGVDVLVERLREVAVRGVDSALAEAAAQGATIEMPDIDAIVEGLEARAQATATLMARSLSEAAGRRAVALTGGSLAPEQVAEQVVEYIEGLSDAYLEEQFTGLLTQGQNTGRRAVFAEAPSIRAVYASELLDSSTCEACADVDGREYPDLQSAEEDYPTGGFKDCAGGARCRGTLVAVYEDEATPSVN